jgi:hypothetical protein
MTWHPEPRPEWVRAVNAGHVVPITAVAELPFDRDRLLGEARAHLGIVDGGIADFGDDGFLEPLDILVRALEEEAELTVVGRWITRRFLLRLLEVRLQLVNYIGRDPGVRDEVIEAPLFVTGAPRTGTSILHALLAEDRAHRAPEGWELLRPVPPPEPSTFETDPRIALADDELRLPATIVSGLDAIHVYGGRMPKECLSAMSFEFRSEEFISRYRVPTYVRWFQQCDMRPAYESHRLVLQILQRRSPGKRWALKSPVHLNALPTLLAVYPDARLAVTHRDPLTVLGSVTSLVATLRWAHSDAVDFSDIGHYHAELYHRALDGLVTRSQSGTLDAARTHHGHYADFMADPFGAVGKLYAHLGLTLEADTAERMRSYLARRPKDQHGTHRYSFEDLGLDRDAERSHFARYQDHFGVPVELRES